MGDKQALSEPFLIPSRTRQILAHRGLQDRSKRERQCHANRRYQSCLSARCQCPEPILTLHGLQTYDLSRLDIGRLKTKLFLVCPEMPLSMPRVPSGAYDNLRLSLSLGASADGRRTALRCREAWWLYSNGLKYKCAGS